MVVQRYFKPRESTLAAIAEEETSAPIDPRRGGADVKEGPLEHPGQLSVPGIASPARGSRA